MALDDDDEVFFLDVACSRTPRTLNSKSNQLVHHSMQIGKLAESLRVEADAT